MVAAAAAARARAPRRRRRPRPRPGDRAPRRGRPRPTTVVQDQQNGTGHAVACALDGLPAARRHRGRDLRRRPAAHRRDPARAARPATPTSGNAVTVLTALVADPTGYGRIVRDADGGSRPASSSRRTPPTTSGPIREINSGVYAFDAAALRAGAGPAGHRQRAGRGVPHRRARHRCAPRRPGRRASSVDDTWQIEGVNDRVQLAELRRELNGRTVERWMRAGVTVVDPATTWVDVDVHPRAGRRARARTRCCTAAPASASGAVVGPELPAGRHRGGRGRQRRQHHADGAEIGPEATVGPYTYLRPGTRLGRGAKVGAFVEMKNADARRRRQGPAPVLRRRRDHRRGRQHRRRHDLRQLRRCREAPHHRRRRTRSSAATPCWWRR